LAIPEYEDAFKSGFSIQSDNGHRAIMLGRGHDYRRLITPPTTTLRVLQPSDYSPQDNHEGAPLDFALLCKNGTRYDVDLIFYRCFPGEPPAEWAHVDLWKGPGKARRNSRDEEVIWSSFGECPYGYFQIFGSVCGQQAQLLFEDNLFRYLSITIVINDFKEESNGHITLITADPIFVSQRF
jgi:hypothetical protein